MITKLSSSLWKGISCSVGTSRGRQQAHVTFPISPGYSCLSSPFSSKTPSMATTTPAVPDTYSVDIVPTAVGPPMSERRLPKPTFSPCTLDKRWLSDQNGDNSAIYEMIVETQSGRIWLFERLIMKALYGEVWRAVEVTIEDGRRYIEQRDEEGKTRRFAVKRMPWDKIEHKKRVENPMNEIAALTIVSDPGHPNVLPLEAALNDGETIYILTPFVDGGEMFGWVCSQKGLDAEPRTAIMRPLFRQLMEGMVYMHSKGICHADLSLENVLIDAKKGRSYIIDFGMCLLMPIDKHNRRKAKASYCSPETHKSKAYDGVKVDVFAAGSILFMMLTGSYPFAKPSRGDPRFKRLVYDGNVEEVIHQSELPPVGDQAVDLLKKMMAYRPEDRPLPEKVLQHPWLTP